MRKEQRVYLGDSVYAVWNGYEVALYLDNGAGPRNYIILEPAVIEALLAFLAARLEPSP